MKTRLEGKRILINLQACNPDMMKPKYKRRNEEKKGKPHWHSRTTLIVVTMVGPEEVEEQQDSWVSVLEAHQKMKLSHACLGYCRSSINTYFFIITGTITYPTTEARNVEAIPVSSALYPPFPESSKADVTQKSREAEI